MSDIQESLKGREFDWFAIDQAGNVAIFSTAGEGTIPLLVASIFHEHDAISNEIDLPNMGSIEVWSDFARLGLYVFDWSLYDGPYIKVQEPLAELNPILREKVFGLLHIYPVAEDFSLLKEATFST